MYAFGGGSYKQFESASLDKIKTTRFKFQLFERVLELWKDRVKPEQLIDKLKSIRKLEDEEASRDLDRGDDGMGALGQIDAGKQVIIDPYKEALISGFIGLNVSVNTASLWGRYVCVCVCISFSVAPTITLTLSLSPSHSLPLQTHSPCGCNRERCICSSRDW